MRNDKRFAIKLRKQGKSYNKISKELEIPKGTLSNWFSGIEWSEGIKRELIRKANYIARKNLQYYNKKHKEKWEKWREEARQQAKREFPKLMKDSLFIAGLMLYWAEGDSKIKNPIRLSNTDPRMIALYIKFLTKSLKISKEKLRSTIILYPDLSEKKCIDFWTAVEGIPKSQFYKTQFIKGRHPTKRLTHGICMIIFSSRQIKEKILIWIDLLSKNL